jgi:hypothetical protein
MVEMGFGCSFYDDAGLFLLTTLATATAASPGPRTAEIAVLVGRIPMDDAVIRRPQRRGRRTWVAELRRFDRGTRSRPMDPPLLRDNCGAPTDGDRHHEPSDQRGSHGRPKSDSTR